MIDINKKIKIEKVIKDEYKQIILIIKKNL